MADETIDSLSIGISVNDKGSAEKIQKVAKAIDSLVSSLKGLESLQDVLKMLENTLGSIGRMGSKATKNIKVPNAKAPQTQELAENVSSGNLRQISGNGNNFNQITQSLSKVETQTEKTTSKFSQFFASVKRIALYRAIRTALKEIVQAMQYGIQNYARDDDATNKAMSNVMNSVNQLKNTLGVTFGQIMQTLAPLIEMLTNAVVGLLDNINMALASLGNKSTYSRAIKQNEDYAKSLDKVNGKLLSFDTFNTLATQNQSEGLFEEVKISNEMNDFAQFLTEVFGLVKELFGILKEAFNLIKEVFEYIRPKLDLILQFVGGVIQQIRGAIQVIRGILKIFTGDFQGAFGLIGKGFENLLKGMGNMFIALLNSLIDGLNFLFVQLNPLKWVVDLFGGDTSGWGIPHIPYFANGGSFNSADMFYANENGQTELIASSNNGGAVMNMEQLQGAIYNGMIMAMADSGGKEVVLKVDQNTLGRVVANSAGFISETNRIKLIKV